MGRGGVEWMTGREHEVMPQLFERMATGKTVSAICREEGWPIATIRTWCFRPHWKQRYYEAVMSLGTAQGERVIEEAEKALTERDPIRMQGIKILVQALMWQASKHNSKMYGDKVDLTSMGQRLAAVVLLPDEQPLEVQDGRGNVIGEGTQRSLAAGLPEGVQRPAGEHSVQESRREGA